MTEGGACVYHQSVSVTASKIWDKGKQLVIVKSSSVRGVLACQVFLPTLLRRQAQVPFR